MPAQQRVRRDKERAPSRSGKDPAGRGEKDAVNRSQSRPTALAAQDLLVLRTGMQWNALNATGVCSSSSAHRRFQERERAGVFGEIWRQGLLEYDEVVGIDWSFLAADGAMTKAPLGGAKTGPNPTDRAKKGVRCGKCGRAWWSAR